MGRPFVLSGETFRLKTEAGNLYVTVNKNEGGAPIEVFIHLGKAGSTVNTLVDALGRMISIALQHGVPVYTIVNQLSYIKSGEAYEQEGGEWTTSIPDAVAYALEKSLGLSRLHVTELLKGESKRTVTGELCGRCGGAIVKIGACTVCLNCGESTCS